MQVIKEEPLGTPPLVLYVRKCTKCSKYAYFYNHECYICNEEKLR